MEKSQKAEQITRFEDVLAAMGTESRLEIIRPHLAAYLPGLVVGDIRVALGIPPPPVSSTCKVERRGSGQCPEECTSLTG